MKKEFMGIQPVKIYAELKEYNDDFVISKDMSESIAEEIEDAIGKKHPFERDSLEIDDDITIILELNLEVSGITTYYPATWMEPADYEISCNHEFTESELMKILSENLSKYKFRIYLDDVEVTEEW